MCHLKHLFRYVERKITFEGQMIKWSQIELVQAITCTFMHGFKNILDSCSPSQVEVLFETFVQVL